MAVVRRLAMISFLLVGILATVNGHLFVHGPHKNLFGRHMRKPTVSSGSGFLITTTHDSIIGSTTPSNVGGDGGYFHGGSFHYGCDSSNDTNLSNILPRVTPVPQNQLDNRQLGVGPSAAVVKFRGQRLPAFTKHRHHPSHGSLSTNPMLPSQGSLTLPTPHPTGVIVGPANMSGSNVEHDTPLRFGAQRSMESLAPRQDDGYQSFVLGGFSSFATTSLSTSILSPPMTASSSPISTPSPTSSICPANNGTTYTSNDGIDYQITCNTDIKNKNLQGQSVISFAGCVQKCDAWNYDHHGVQCVAIVFVPGRAKGVDDCYLKSSQDDPVATTEFLEAAMRVGYATGKPTISASASSAQSAAGSTLPLVMSASSTAGTTSSLSTAPATSGSSVSSPGVTYGSGNSVIVPKFASSHLQGPVRNTPSEQYVDVKEPDGLKLAGSLLKVGVNGDLTTKYDISSDTGVLEVNISTQSHLKSLKHTPHLSRDGGRGGMVNGEHLFVFCDTGSYSTTTSSSNGNFLGFVSSSVAIDVGMKGLSGGALNLQDGIGEWSDDVGRMRSFAPLTEGELAYNLAMQGQGLRYAVWPESDIIPLDSATGIMYAPIVYDNVNQVTKVAVFTYTGTTLLTITAGGKSGPVAKRTVTKMFQQDQIEWGCAGGIRSWGPSGVGGNDGRVYLFGSVANGILLARTSPAEISDVKSIEYWNGKSWTKNMLTSSSTAYFISGAFMDINVFYSPRHLTFIAVYLTIYADSTFYYRYLEPDQGILPPFAPGGDKYSDYVENILKYEWSEQQVLYKAAKGLSGKYIYSGGPHLGYYGSNDISNGGTKMLLSWTAPTGLDPSTLESEYQIITAEVDWA